MNENSYETIEVRREGRVGVITLNRPKALNALNEQTMRDVVAAATELDRDPGIGALILTGSEKAFAAGVDIKEMSGKSASDMYHEDFFAGWDAFARLRTPKIAAVAGYALGGGCELAMMCDLVLAADTAVFGQPEITLGVIPGMGGTQRLTRAVGKAKAMDMILTGRQMRAEEAERSGLVSRVVAADELMDTALEVAGKIAEMSKPVAQHAVETVNAAYESGLWAGVQHERRVFHGLFSTADQKEGMSAFAEKRKAQFSHE